MGQPTDGMMVAAVPPFRCGRRTPMMRVSQTGNNGGVADRRVLVFSQVAAHPGDAFSAHDVIGINHPLQAGNGSYVSAHHDHGIRR